MKKSIHNIVFIFLGLLLIITGCDEAVYLDCEEYDYYDCDTWEPTHGTLIIYITINQDNKAVPIAVYNGNFENGDLIFRDTLNGVSTSYDMEVDHYYSVTALYATSDGPLYAVDGDDIEKRAVIKCDSTCWTVKDAIIKLELKN